MPGGCDGGIIIKISLLIIKFHLFRVRHVIIKSVYKNSPVTLMKNKKSSKSNIPDGLHSPSQFYF